MRTFKPDRPVHEEPAERLDNAPETQVTRTRLEALKGLAPYQSVAIAIAVILTVIVVSANFSTNILIGWIAAVFVSNWLSLMMLDRVQRSEGSGLLGKFGLWGIAADAAIRSAIVISVPAYAFTGAAPMDKIVLFGITVCVTASAALLAIVPAAALAWAAVSVAAMLWTLHRGPADFPLIVSAIPVVFTGILAFGLTRIGALLASQFSLGARLTRQNKSASMLLEEYEQRGLGWLWETDRHNRLVYISPQIGAMLGQATSKLREHSFPSIFGGSIVLSSHLQKMVPFDKVELEVTTRNGTRWVSISGTPKTSRTGIFDGYRGSGSDITEGKLSKDRLVNLAKIDSLTGLPNRAQIKSLLEESLTKAQSSFGQCGVLFLDLDDFKPVNDTYGHSKGDALLKAVAGRLTNAVAGYGQVARYGGDEFAVILPSVDGRKAMENFATRLIEVVSETYLIDNSQLNVGCSIGGAMGPSDGKTVEELLKHSDLALYHAKDNGRGTYRHFDLDLQKRIDHRIDMERALREALALDQFELHYQPIVSAQSPEVLGFEALIRWEHPTRGRMSPAEFIPIAEEVGLIGEIGEWVLRTACRDAAAWPSNISISVNVSPLQLLSSTFPNAVGQALARSRLSPNRLELEVTESIFLTDSEGALKMLKRLQTQGVKVALDDFGTGYSSLGYLNKAIFNKLKIDRSFVREAGIKKEAVLIVQAIVALANSFRMTITAEGVETADELKLMRDLGCHQIQGYIYSKPLPYAKTFDLFEQAKDNSKRLAG